jgi:hypothetical protein
LSLKPNRIKCSPVSENVLGPLNIILASRKLRKSNANVWVSERKSSIAESQNQQNFYLDFMRVNVEVYNNFAT